VQVNVRDSVLYQATVHRWENTTRRRKSVTSRRIAIWERLSSSRSIKRRRECYYYCFGLFLFSIYIVYKTYAIIDLLKQKGIDLSHRKGQLLYCKPTWASRKTTLQVQQHMHLEMRVQDRNGRIWSRRSYQSSTDSKPIAMAMRMQAIAIIPRTNLSIDLFRYQATVLIYCVDRIGLPGGRSHCNTVRRL
jgi:hypothetical protein